MQDRNAQETFVIHTDYSLRQMRTFIRFAFKKFRQGSIVMLIILAFMVLTLLLNPYASANWSPLWIVICVAPVHLLLYSSGILYTRKRHEKQKGIIENGQTYTFTTDGFTAESNNPDASGLFNYTYKVVYKVLETKDMIYLFTAKTNAILLDKQGFREGTLEDFRALLRGAVPRKKLKLWK